MRCPECGGDGVPYDNVTNPLSMKYVCRECGTCFDSYGPITVDREETEERNNDECVDPEWNFDQTAKQDDGKLKLTLVPTQIIRDIAEVREYGNRKYGDKDNWKTVEPERYRDALYRHFLAYLEDPSSIDEESGIPHYKHMACNMAFLCEMEAQKR